MARAAGLHKESCLQATAGSISRADAWHMVVEHVESKWGGPQAFLAASNELAETHKAGALERREEFIFEGLVEQTGGRAAVTELLNIVASAGGVQHVLKALGPVQLSQVCNFLEALRRGGGRFQDLLKLSSLAAEAGGLTRLVRTMEKVQDASKLSEVVEYGDSFHRQGLTGQAEQEPEKHAELLAKTQGTACTTCKSGAAFKGFVPLESLDPGIARQTHEKVTAKVSAQKHALAHQFACTCFSLPERRVTLRREVLVLTSAEVLRPKEASAQGFDPFGEEQKKKAPKDLKTPPADAQVTKSGLKWKILKPVDCETQKCAKPRSFDKVSVDFTGYQLDGTIFDTSRKRGRVTCGVGQVIRGWTEGLQLMNVGEVARLWIPESLAFGSEGKSGPAGDIVVDVKLYGIKRGPNPPPTPEDVSAPPPDAVFEPSGLATKVVRPGNGTQTAKEAEFNRAVVEWYGWTADGQLFDASLNQGKSAVEVQQQNVPKGFWEGIGLMLPGETRRFWVPAALGYGKTRTDGGPAGPLVFDVFLEEAKKDFFR
ncbi:unnamed protein product [Effrenium voratum]|nr:unnamed protein product [Effrenium voratum]